MKIIADNKIPYLEGAFEDVAEVIYKPGADTTAEDIADCDAIVTRTRTKCHSELLENSSVKFIATATIGFDHIDTNYCKTKGIEWTNAPGCNSGSVYQYIASALVFLAQKHDFELKGKTLGIVGVGNVGKKVAHLGKCLGMRVLLNDPPREAAEDTDQFVSIQTIQEQCDIITFHTPLNRTGQYATMHMVDHQFIEACKHSPFVINAARGELFKTSDIVQALKNRKVQGAIIDCWENEPNINTELLKLVDIATPHIAGYSKDGKANGTSMSVQAISRHFKLGKDHWTVKNIEQPKEAVIRLNCSNTSFQTCLTELIEKTYRIEEDDTMLRRSIGTFEKQRGDYPVRREFFAHQVILENANQEITSVIQALGFVIKD